MCVGLSVWATVCRFIEVECIWREEKKSFYMIVFSAKVNCQSGDQQKKNYLCVILCEKCPVKLFQGSKSFSNWIFSSHSKCHSKILSLTKLHSFFAMTPTIHTHLSHFFNFFSFIANFALIFLEHDCRTFWQSKLSSLEKSERINVWPFCLFSPLRHSKDSRLWGKKMNENKKKKHEEKYGEKFNRSVLRSLRKIKK